MNAISMGGYTRISKRAASKLYNTKTRVYICACKLRPDNMWQPAIEVKKSDYDFDFSNYVNEFEYYNCDNERGKYASFYIKD